MLLDQRWKRANHLERLSITTRNPAKLFVGGFKAIDADVQVNMQFGTAGENRVQAVVGALREQSVRRQIHPANAIVAVEKLDDPAQFLPHERFATRKPKIGDRWHGFRDSANLLECEIALLVEFLPIETVAAFLIANGGNKEHDRIQAFGPEYLLTKICDLFQGRHGSKSPTIRFE